MARPVPAAYGLRARLDAVVETCRPRVSTTAPTARRRLGRRLAIIWLADLPHHRAYRSVHGGSKYRVYNRWIEALVYADKCSISQ